MKDLSLLLFENGLIKIGSFKLSSGIISPFYIDLRGLISYPKVLKRIAKMILDLVSVKTNFDVVAGIATGGIPLAAFISSISEIPMAYVRKEKKGHGLEKLIEGIVNGKRVLLVDDVATTGASLEYAINVLRENGAIIDHAAVIVDREEGAKERLERIGVKLLSLTTAKEIFTDLYTLRIIDKETFQRIITYLNRKR